jgi:excinuclease ABC subunit C
MPDRTALLDQVSRFPESAGVYIMRDAAKTPIYIGKAVNLRSRVRSYFSDAHETRAQIPFMLERLSSIDWIATNTESEALILESNLIRRHRPRYNIDLRDDKHFPYLAITVQDPFPRLLVVRRVEQDGARYFGPYTDATAMRRIVSFAKRIFKLCDCSGRRNRLLDDLSARMERASAALRFEESARFRDQIRLIRDASRLQQVDLKIPDADCDAFGIAQAPRQTCIAVLRFREGLLISSNRFLVDSRIWDLSQTDRDTAVYQFYLENGRETPPEIVLPPEGGFNVPALQQLFDSGPLKTAVTVPQRGTRLRLAAMAEKNARLHLLQKGDAGPRQDCFDLQKALGLPVLPETIEAFDISNLGGSFAVAGMVRFRSGVPDKPGYRRFKIKTVEGQNDFAMMMEAVSRRLTRLQNEQQPFPDLILIDGGAGQLHAAMKALDSFEHPPQIAALAKKEETLYSPCIGAPLKLPASHPARHLVERIRDEVHRYAVGYHRKVRGKQFTRSSIEELPGIGPRKARLLLRKFGSLQRLRKAKPEDIADVKGLNLAQALKLRENLEKLP